LEVREYCSEEMWIPNAFSPDEDGWNDDFGGLTSSPKKLGSYTLMVFDRWGQLMFLSNRYEDRWNGTLNSNEVPPGTYPYLLLYQFPGKNPQTKKGLVTVVK
jgi:gliding motility-associated-like protein